MRVKGTLKNFETTKMLGTKAIFQGGLKLWEAARDWSSSQKLFVA